MRFYLKRDSETGAIHFPGGSLADTSTLCGFGTHAALNDTDDQNVTCEACLEIIKSVRKYRPKKDTATP